MTNVANKKRYIGQTTRTLAERRAEHKYHAFSLKTNNPLYASIRKHGWQSFSWKILLVAENNQLDSLEEQLIEAYGVLNRKIGYNLKKGGNRTLHSAETRRKIGIGNTGKDGLIGKDNPMYGRTGAKHFNSKLITIVHVDDLKEVTGYFQDLRKQGYISSSCFRGYTSKSGWVLKQHINIH